ncbi:MAG: flagellin [Bryobacteraceae bacterium]
MAYSINLNVASLQAQEYLRTSQEFQSKTINRVTSGLRIVASGDDAAGLAIANTFRSDRAVISQGIRNANDGISTLQTIDGGLNNISQLLDRARTLATQSATGTFNGDRAVLDSEFQSVIGEIDRQAQAIGLNAGGLFATNLKAFIGGGKGSTNAATISNGTVQVDLSQSNVDARGLKLKGYQASGANAADVDEIVGDSTNVSSEIVAGKTDFFIRGAGFSDDSRIRVSVNLAGVDTADELVTAINNGITEAGNGGTDAATAFKNTAVRAKIVTNSDNSQKLVFESSNGAFQVAAGDRLANALLGNHTSNVGTSLDYIVDGGVAVASTGTTFSAARDIVLRVQGGTLTTPTDLTLSVTTTTTVDTALTSLSSLVANNSSLIAAGITLTTATVGSALRFTSKRGENFEVLAVNDVGNRLGLGAAQNTTSTAAGTGFDVTSITTASFSAASGSATIGFSIGGGSYVTFSQTFSSSASVSDLVNSLNSQFSQNSSLQQAGLVAATGAGSTIVISSNNGTYFRVNSQTVSGSFNLGFSTLSGTAGTTSVSTTSQTASAALVAGGAASSGLLAFSAIRNGNDDQALTITAKDSSGVEQSVAITLAADSGAQHARTIDEALHYINAQIQATGNDALKQIVAVKERDGAASGAEKIRFISALNSFKVAVGDNPNDTGVTTSQGSVVNSSLLSGGSNIDISTAANAETAVNSLAAAVAQLGRVQASVGRGQNQFNFAVSLAQTQLTNIAASESRIRDADLAAEAANLTRAQILQQAGIAALAQANAAPQAVLSLLRG